MTYQKNSSTELLLCAMLNCGSADLSLLEDVGYDWDDVIEATGWEGSSFSDVSLNGLMRGVVCVGLDRLEQSVNDRICELEAIPNERPLDDEEEEELLLLRGLKPHEDVKSFHNCLDTHVWFEKNAKVYRKYLFDAVCEVEDNIGFAIGE